MMKRTPGMIVMALGTLALQRFVPLHLQPAHPATQHAAHGRLSALPADDSGGDDGDDDGGSGDSE